MKKILALLFVAILPFAVFTACSDDDNSPVTPPTAQQLVEAVKGYYGVTIKESGQSDITGAVTATTTTDNKINFEVVSDKVNFTLPAVSLKGDNVNNVTFDQTVKSNIKVDGIQVDGVDVKVEGSVKDGVMTSTITYTIGDNKTVLNVSGAAKVKTLADKAAGTYPVGIMVKLNSTPANETPIASTVIITKPSTGKATAPVAENVINLELKDFSFEPVGAIPINVSNVLLKKGEGEKVLIENHTSDLSLAFLGEDSKDLTAPLTINGVIENGKLALTLKIDAMTALDMVIDVKVDGTVK